MILFQICLILLFTCANLTAQSVDREKKVSKRNVPLAVLDTFKVHYPDAQKIKYYQEISEGKPFWEIEFRLGNTSKAATYDEKGMLLQTEQLIGFSQLSDSLEKSIRLYLDSNFSKYQIKKVELVFAPKQHSPQMVEITIWSRSKSYYGVAELFFDDKGREVKQRNYEFQSVPTAF